MTWSARTLREMIAARWPSVGSLSARSRQPAGRRPSAGSSRRISTRPVVPSTRTRSPVTIRWVATDVPMTAGIPNSRARTAGCEVGAAGVGDEPGDLREQDDPGRVRHLADEDVAVADVVELVDRADDPGDALDDAGRRAEPGDHAAGRPTASGRSDPGSPS